MSEQEQKLREDVARYFGDAVASDRALVDECVKMCQMFNSSVEDLLYKWEALSYNSSTRSISIFTMKSAADLKAAMQRELKSNRIQPTRPSATVGIIKGKFAPSLDLPFKIGGVSAKTAASPAEIVNSGRRVDLVGMSRVSFQGPRKDPDSLKKRAYKYMYEKITERSEVLDDRIEEFSELVQRHYSIDDLGDPGAATEDPITVVGRIVMDPDASGSNSTEKLMESNIMLEPSRMMGSGLRIPLHFSQNVKLRQAPKDTGGIGFFPGAIVALRGKNGGGGFFLVEEILSLPAIKPPLTNDSRILSSDSSLSVCVASGPFTSDSDLLYHTWRNFVTHLKTIRPAVVLLVGPFVDASHPHVKDGIMDVSPAELFQREFTTRLQDFLDDVPGSTIILVPSVHDIISDHAVFPQCEFGFEVTGDPRIRLVPNPCQFSLNGLTLAVTSVDVLFHLKKAEFFRRTEEIDPLSSSSETLNDGMTNICRHILQQRSFYPLFPVPSDLGHEVNLDVSHSDGLRILDADHESAPHVLILPSRLKHFSKNVDSTTVVNPSYISKGSYALLSCLGHPENMKVEILKI